MTLVPVTVLARRTRLAAVAMAVCIFFALPASASLARPGDVDGGFGAGGFTTLGGGTTLSGMAVRESDGRAVAVGYTQQGSDRVLLGVRLGPTGGVEGSFGAPGGFGPAEGRDVAFQRDGKFVVVGAATTGGGMIVGRFNADGSLDGSFSGGWVRIGAGSLRGEGNAVAIQGDGKIVVAGSAVGGDGFPRLAVARLNTNGSLDGSFGSGGLRVQDVGRNSVANGVAIQGDGKIVVAGSQANDLRVTNTLVARFTSGGVLDGSFAGGAAIRQYATGGAAFSAFNDVGILPNGRIVGVGVVLQRAANGSTASNALAVGLAGNGQQDGGFGSGGVVRLAAGRQEGRPSDNPGAYSVTIDSGARVLIGGTSNAARGIRNITLWALSSSGGLDGGFGSGGAVVTSRGSATISAATDLAVRSDRLYVSGFQNRIAQPTSGFAGRYVTFPAPPTFDPRHPKVSVSGGKRGRIKIGRKGVFRLKVKNSNPFSVRVSLTIPSAKKLRTRAHHRKRKVTFAKKRFTARANHTSKLKIKLSRKNRALVRKLRKVRVVVTLSLSAQGKRAKVKKKFTLVR